MFQSSYIILSQDKQCGKFHMPQVRPKKKKRKDYGHIKFGDLVPNRPPEKVSKRQRYSLIQLKLHFKKLLQINQQKECKNNTSYTREQDWR